VDKVSAIPEVTCCKGLSKNIELLDQTVVDEWSEPPKIGMLQELL